MNRLAFAVLFAALSASTVAHAGQRDSNPVTIDFKSGFAHGSMGTARNSADAFQYIGCGVSVYASGLTSMTCTAYNAGGAMVQCSLTNPPAPMTMALSTITSDSFIKFEWNLSTGACTALHVVTGSAQEPRR